MKKHSILALISAMVLSVAATSCDDYLDVNNLTPLEALNKLNDIKRILKGGA